MTPSEQLAIRLKQARIEAGLSQRQVGIKAGIVADTAKNRVSHYETRVSVPPLDTLKQLAVALDKPLAWFFASEDEQHLLSSLYAAPSERRAELVVLIEKLLENQLTETR